MVCDFPVPLRSAPETIGKNCGHTKYKLSPFGPYVFLTRVFKASSRWDMLVLIAQIGHLVFLK